MNDSPRLTAQQQAYVEALREVLNERATPWDNHLAIGRLLDEKFRDSPHEQNLSSLLGKALGDALKEGLIRSIEDADAIRWGVIGHVRVAETARLSLDKALSSETRPSTAATGPAVIASAGKRLPLMRAVAAATFLGAVALVTGNRCSETGQPQNNQTPEADLVAPQLATPATERPTAPSGVGNTLGPMQMGSDPDKCTDLLNGCMTLDDGTWLPLAGCPGAETPPALEPKLPCVGEKGDFVALLTGDANWAPWVARQEECQDRPAPEAGPVPERE